jgi:hypothetical protein
MEFHKEEGRDEKAGRLGREEITEGLSGVTLIEEMGVTGNRMQEG